MSDRNGEFRPILSLGIDAITDAERAGIERAFAAWVQGNPEIRVELEAAEKRLLLLGEDELELEAVCQHILATDSVETGKLQILYRETIRQPVEAEGRYIRQTSGKGNYGHCWLRIEPNERDEGYKFINNIKGGVVPREYIEPINQAIQSVLKLGILAGFPVVDVKVTLFDGSYHVPDSNEMAFQFAGSIALKEAARKAKPVVLEPVMAVEAQVPEDLLDAAARDIRARRGRIVNIDEQDGLRTIHALVPLAELLRSSDRGRPRYSIRFAGYDVIPGIDGDDTAVYATRPIRPTPRSGSAAADIEF